MAMCHIYLSCFIFLAYIMTCSSSGTYYKKFSGQGHVYSVAPSNMAPSRLGCLAACQRSEPQCIGVNYDEEKKTCELLDYLISPSEGSEETTWVSETFLPETGRAEANSTGVDFDELMGTSLVAALPNGQAVAHILNNDTVVRVENFQIIRDLYTAVDIRGLQVQGSNLFVVHGSGHVVEMRPQDGFILQVYNTGATDLRNYGSHYTDLCDIDLNVLLFASWYLGEVYSYNISSQTRKVHVDNLDRPMTITFGCINGSVVYVVSDHRAHKVYVYNSTWSLITSFGGLGSSNGQLNNPLSAVISDQGHIFVTDRDNHRVSIFTSDGQFVKHIIIYEVPYYESVDGPWSLSVRGKYLWITTSGGRLTRYIL